MIIAEEQFDNSVTLGQVISHLNSKGIFDVNFITNQFQTKQNELTAQELIDSCDGN